MLADEARAAGGSAFTFDEVEAGVDDNAPRRRGL